MNIQHSNAEWDQKIIIGSKSRPKKPSEQKAGQMKEFYGGNKTASTEGSHLARVDREDEPGKVATIALDVSRAIQQGRLNKKMTQKELATKINEKPQVIQDFESGKAKPNQQVLGKIERVLGVKLRGKDIGAQLGPKVKK
eukprot:NODE_175_length_15885_cov_0.420563.p9 type:complete len:140 gc:universal NODE_175_length_15885_cov_0.420563:8922-8503(-)